MKKHLLTEKNLEFLNKSSVPTKEQIAKINSLEKEFLLRAINNRKIEQFNFESAYLEEVRDLITEFKTKVMHNETNYQLEKILELQKNIEQLSNPLINPNLKESFFKPGTYSTSNFIIMEKLKDLSEVLSAFLLKRSKRKRVDSYESKFISQMYDEMDRSQAAAYLLAGLNETFSEIVKTGGAKFHMKTVVSNSSSILMTGMVANYLATIIKDIRYQIPMYLERRLMEEFSRRSDPESDNSDWKIQLKRNRDVLTSSFNITKTVKINNPIYRNNKDEIMLELGFESSNDLVINKKLIELYEKGIGSKPLLEFMGTTDIQVYKPIFYNSYFIRKGFLTWPECFEILHFVKTKYNIILMPILFDTLLSLSRFAKSNQLWEITTLIPNQQIQYIVNEIDSAGLKEGIFKVLADQTLKSKVLDSFREISEDGITHNTVYKPIHQFSNALVQHSLPMLCPPRDWELNAETGEIHGGYLLQGDNIVTKTSPVSSKNISKLFLTPKAKRLALLNKQQSLPFKINKHMLNWIENNKKFLIQEGILTHPAYMEFDIKAFTKDLYLLKKELNISDPFFIRSIVIGINKKKGLALEESLILKVASILQGLPLWFPCFLDFRGRIYRSGYPSIQGSRLSRCLLQWNDLFVNSKGMEKSLQAYSNISKIVNQTMQKEIIYALGQAIQKCTSLKEAFQIGTQYLNDIRMPNINMEDPFLYASIVCVKYPRLEGQPILDPRKAGIEGWLTQDHLLIPARKDAAASVFQIISTISGDSKLAFYCNILNKPQYSNINDLYTLIYTDFLSWFKQHPERVSKFVEDLAKNSLRNNNKENEITKKDWLNALQHLKDLIYQENSPVNRKVIKAVIMPYLYGISVEKASSEIRDHLAEKGVIFHKNLVCILLTKFIFYYIETAFPKIVNTKMLFSKLGQLAAFFGLPLRWHLDQWATVTQGYVKMETRKLNVTIQGKLTRRSGFNYISKTPFLVPLKSKTSSPANRTHSIDALIMYKILDIYLSRGIYCASIHDCCVTTWCQIHKAPEFYFSSLKSTLTDPVDLINHMVISSFAAIIPAEFLPKSQKPSCTSRCTLNFLEKMAKPLPRKNKKK